MKNKESIDVIRHSCAHVLAAAIQSLYPQARFGVGPVIENGFYYDIEIPGSAISQADLPTIEKAMKSLIKKGVKFEQVEISLQEAIDFFAQNDQPYKVELLKELQNRGTTRLEDSAEPYRADQPVSLYKTGTFTDLCRGPHVSSTKEITPFKLTNVAGAYWRGDEKNPMLTRIYGVCFSNKDELAEHLRLLEEAKRRDHRKIGKELDLFFFDDLVGKGLPIWLPNGQVMKTEIEKLAEEFEYRYGYDRITTPHLAKKELYEASGHIPYYQDDMYPPMEMDDGTYYLKAMNCPHHHLVYNSKPRSYRDLPIRLAEYGTVYRNELSGTLAGLLRVRMLSMNDAHIYCRKDQIQDELKKVIELNLEYFKLFGLQKYWFRFSKWSAGHTEKYVNEPANWEYTQQVMKEILDDLGVNYIEVEDEAAFYGPKIDVQFKSVIGREETMSTIQLDFAAKTRFDLKYTDNKGDDNNEVYVIHRAPLSTHERFMAFLIEHYAGNFPVWLSPIQISLLPVGSDHHDYVAAMAAEFKTAGLRTRPDYSNETIGNKIRKTSSLKIPYTLVIGDKEINSDKLQVRLRGEKELLEITKADFITRVKEEIEHRKS
ncbi:MAG: threonine--tRNA ligase [Candidatus Komeilibacteria bacterium]|nr:threonine--tRNA ligase [Candidatus Komeilibacteria bacterium]